MLTRRSDAMKAAAMANNQANTVGGRKRTKSARETAVSDERVTSDESVTTSVERVTNVESVTDVATACPDHKRTNVNAASSRPMTRKEL
jgi:hypothetical protein